MTPGFVLAVFSNRPLMREYLRLTRSRLETEAEVAHWVGFCRRLWESLPRETDEPR